MVQIRFILFTVFCLGSYLTSKATHNRAGEITYKWISGYTYQIKITTYTNIGSGNIADRCEDTLYFGDGSRATVLRSNGPLGPCSPATNGVPISSIIKLNEYVTTHTYSGPGNYLLSMEDPNRNANVINIPNSVNQVFYIESYLVIPASGSGKNDSPILTFNPTDNGCVGQCFYHNPGAYDLDGDSLSYELTSSKGHLGQPCPGYTYPSTGGGTYTINASTGTLAWCTPQIQGDYNLAMLIKEWRRDNNGNYFLIGYVERDLQVTVGNCNNLPPHIQVANSDTCILEGTFLTHTVTATDANSADIITLTANGAPFVFASNPSSFNASPGTSPLLGIFNWQTDPSHVRHLPYQLTFKVTDDDPIVILPHFETFNVKVIPNVQLMLSTTIPANDNILLTWNRPANMPSSGTNPFYKYKVYRKTGTSSWVHSASETVPPAYTGFVYLGANTVINDTLFHDYNSAIPFIPGQDYSYVVLAEYVDGATSYVSNISSKQFVVGINELLLDVSKLSLYPNPVSENLVISFNQNATELFTVELIDLMGRKIKTLAQDITLSKDKNTSINLEYINTGIYFIKITDSNSYSVTKKFIKQ
jgi:hypothetical protein